MTAPASIDLSGWLTEQLAQASPDLLRDMVASFVQALMSAEADAVGSTCGRWPTDGLGASSRSVAVGCLHEELVGDGASSVVLVFDDVQGGQRELLS
jgi:hypothetical protein